MSKKYIVKIIKEGEDLIIPIPDNLTTDMDWKENDILDWCFHDDYVTITKGDPEIAKRVLDNEEVNLNNYYNKGKLKV